MQNFISTYKQYILGIAIGGIAGFLYWRFVGCNSGTCPITSTWHNTTLYGMLMGILIASPSKKRQEKQDIENSNKSTKDQ
ncbi:MAG: hypothetical protein GXX78_05505 [Bacteroidales bacterium]|nr:hypothetical protein [Bacteroidales bacterium]HPB06514.1 DUF6132 family protein [Prolixibacteraceae bacterium]